MDIEKIGKAIVNSAIKVHRNLEPGLLESVYQKCLAYELEKSGHNVECELAIPAYYEDIEMDVGFRADKIVDSCVLVENKAVDKLVPIHEAQLLTYLKVTQFQFGFILNWNVRLMKDGIKRMMNNLQN